MCCMGGFRRATLFFVGICTKWEAAVERHCPLFFLCVLYGSFEVETLPSVLLSVLYVRLKIGQRHCSQFID
jgi:hypothetical protein